MAAPYNVRLDPDEARQFAEHGGTLLLLDVPEGTSFGIDQQVGGILLMDLGNNPISVHVKWHHFVFSMLTSARMFLLSRVMCLLCVPYVKLSLRIAAVWLP